MTPNIGPQLPLIAKATSPKYPDRIAVVFVEDALFATWTFESTTARDAEIDRMVRQGVVERIHMHCPYPGCKCTFPTMLMEEDRDGNPVPRRQEERPARVRRAQKSARRAMRRATGRRS